MLILAPRTFRLCRLNDCDEARDRLRSWPHPDLMVEVKSPTDSLAKLEAKIPTFLKLGTRVGILVNPDDRTGTVYRAKQEAVTLRDGEVLTVLELLPGWEVASG